MIYNSITQLIGRTPLVEITGLEGQQARLAVKIESFNPGGSVMFFVLACCISGKRHDVSLGGVIRCRAIVYLAGFFCFVGGA